MNFDEKKATQIAAHFLKKSTGSNMAYMKLIKLVYLVDRAALVSWHTTLTRDRYYCLPHGPVGSITKNLATDDHDLDYGPSYWRKYISDPNGYDVHLIADPGCDALSRAEIRLLDDVWKEFGHMSKWQIRDYTHKLPEYKDPDGGALRISYFEILQGDGIDEESAEQISASVQESDKIRLFAVIMSSPPSTRMAIRATTSTSDSSARCWWT